MDLGATTGSETRLGIVYQKSVSVRQGFQTLENADFYQFRDRWEYSDCSDIVRGRERRISLAQRYESGCAKVRWPDPHLEDLVDPFLQELRSVEAIFFAC